MGKEASFSRRNERISDCGKAGESPRMVSAL